VLLAACATPPRATRVQPDAASGPSCIAALAARGVRTEAWQVPDRRCPVTTPVRAISGSRLTPSPGTACSMLLVWSDFEREIDRLARDITGAGLRATHSLGSYACRGMTGNAGRRSLHASGLALDVGGFTLADGTIISVERDWGRWNAKGRFLRAVARAGCRRFSAVLTPATDRFHRDHLHFDLGPWKICDA
jgi:hypothetical protein